MTGLQYLHYQAERVERALETLLPPEQAVPSLIHQAMRYSALGGGKRLRAALTLGAAEAIGGQAAGDAALPAAAAIEMIHAYSLVHDDLPCMDDDDFRRGRPTNHRVFGEGMAVLAGDALLTHAFAVLADLPRLSGIPSGTALRVLQTVAEAAGTQGLIGGQVADLLAERGGTVAGLEDPATLLAFIHRHKTGALFRACLQVGAQIGGASAEQLTAVTTFAEHFGLAFQIVDDILDVVGEAEKTGKATGRDVARGKLTYPALLGLDASRARAESSIRAAKEALSHVGPAEAVQPLFSLADFVLSRDF